jgi:glycosyltransferase involved in cell wall biosynthesis
MNSELISIIICNYNYGEFLKYAIDSIFDQTYTNFELIVVDDGSTDNSKEIISNYTDSRIKKIFKKNGGQASAFNTGFSASSGDLIAFLDSDDAWQPNKLEQVYTTFGKYPDVSLVQHPLTVIDKNSKIKNVRHPGGLKFGINNFLDEYFKQNHTGFFSASSGLASPRKFLVKIFPLDEGWKICADVLFTRPLPIFGPCMTLPEPLGFYRIHENNYWMNTKEQQKISENQKRYTDYTNYWLKKYGYTQCIDFKLSPQYKNYELKKLPLYHPRRVQSILKRWL